MQLQHLSEQESKQEQRDARQFETQDYRTIQNKQKLRINDLKIRLSSGDSCADENNPKWGIVFTKFTRICNYIY